VTESSINQCVFTGLLSPPRETLQRLGRFLASHFIQVLNSIYQKKHLTQHEAKSGKKAVAQRMESTKLSGQSSRNVADQIGASMYYVHTSI
jgi:hypothetical protein